MGQYHNLHFDIILNICHRGNCQDKSGLHEQSRTANYCAVNISRAWCLGARVSEAWRDNDQCSVCVRI